jgi:hypothetical protein
MVHFYHINQMVTLSVITLSGAYGIIQWCFCVLVIKHKLIIHFLDSHPSKVIDNAKNSFGELSLSWFTAFSWPMKQIPHDFSIQILVFHLILFYTV